MKEPVMFFFPIQFEALPAGIPILFFMSPWHLNYSDYFEICDWKKKKEVISIPGPQETSVCFEPL